MNATTRPLTLHDILKQFRDDARNNRDLGDRFERLIRQSSRIDPLLASLFCEVWMSSKLPCDGGLALVGK